MSKDAQWLAVDQIGSAYGEQIDISRPGGASRHRRRDTVEWVDGRAPPVKVGTMTPEQVLTTPPAVRIHWYDHLVPGRVATLRKRLAKSESELVWAFVKSQFPNGSNMRVGDTLPSIGDSRGVD